MYPPWFWRALAFPGIAWLVVFFLAAFYVVLAVAFGTFNDFFEPVPFWNPLDWNVGFLNQVLQGLGPGDPFGRVFLRTIAYVSIAVAVSLAIGYPVAYFVARRAGRYRGLLLVLLVLPFWISYLMRMLAWVNLLAEDGYATRLLHALSIDRLFQALGLLDQGASWLDGQHVAVVIALVYGYLPFLILPIYAAVDRVDQRVIEAARDLGATPLSAFVRVTWPLSRPGVLAGIVLIALPMFGEYYTPDLISQAAETNMIGNQIDLAIRQGTQKPLGAALTVVLSAILALLMVYYLRATWRAGREEAAR